MCVGMHGGEGGCVSLVLLLPGGDTAGGDGVGEGEGGHVTAVPVLLFPISSPLVSGE